MSMRNKAALLASAVISSFAFAGAAHGQAFYLQEQSARGAGRAFSGEVADTGAASLWWNPAAIAGATRSEATLSASAILPRGEVADTGTRIIRPGQAPAPVGGDPVTRNPIKNGVLPSGAIAFPLNDRIALGVAVTSPFSFTTDYPATSWARYSADKTKLRTIDIQPSVGIAVTDWLRIGGAANVEYSDATLGNSLPNLLPTLPDGQEQLKGNGWDLGWSAGVQLHNALGTIGVSYKSAIQHHLNGDLTISGLLGPLAGSNASIKDVEARFYTPSQLIIGARVHASNALPQNGQFVQYGWSKFDAIRLGAPVAQAIPENYRNSWSLAGGVDYDVSPSLTLRAGAQRAITPTRDGNRDARVPDANRWNFGGGASFNVSPAFTINAAANYVDFADAPIDRPTAYYVGTPVQTAILTSGELRNAHAIVLSLGGAVHF